MDDVELAEIVARVGCLYVKRGLSPPFHLRDAARRWMGLSQDEIIEVLERHFAEHRRRYTCGSGDGLFYLVEAAIRAAWQAKHPPIAHADDEPGRPRRKRSGLRKVHNASGIPDVFVDGGRAARLLRDRESNVERPSGLVGYEDAGDPIGEDEEADS
jgi:hypothetical protein